MSIELDALAEKIADAHAGVQKSTRRAVQQALVAGRLLTEAKAKLQRGNWANWVKTNCGFSLRTAQAYMQLAKQGANAQRVANFSLREALRSVSTPRKTATTGSALSVIPGERIIETAFAHFREIGFPYRRVPVHVAMQRLNQLAATGSRELLSSTVGYDVADSYHPHRFHATGAGHLSPVDAFERDDLLNRALTKELEAGRLIPGGYFGGLTIVSRVQPCSNFRPGVALHYYRRYCKPGATVLDSSTGYGGRLVGFLASGLVGRYIGIDPNRDTHDGNLRLASDLGFGNAVELHCLPAEDVDTEVVRNRCDFALTSPPYFCKEHYSEDPTQSWVRYPTLDRWCEGFLAPMLRLQFAALKRGAFNVVNIDDVKIKGVLQPLAQRTKQIAQEIGFELVAVDRLKLPKAFWAVTQDVDVDEPIFVFKKP